MAETPQHPQVLRFGAFEADLRAGELRKRGVKIKLQDQPFQVLALLLKHPGEVVTREELRRALWPEDTFVDFDKSLSTAVNRLREALGDEAENPRFVDTLPRRGYRFIAPVQAPKALAARRAVWILALAALGVAVIVAVLATSNVSGWGTRLLRGTSVPPIQSLAVLPLQNLSGQPDQEYFADGMTDALITELARINALRVVSRTSVMRYKGTKKPLREIVRELQVDAIVEGSVVRSRDRVRVAAHLIYAPADRQLWAESYERDLRDILALQKEIAASVASQVRAKLTPQEQARLKTARAVNPDAYEAYLLGSFHWGKLNEQGLKKSTEYFQKAIEIDPGYAPAYYGMAAAFAVLGQQEILPPRVAYPQAKTAALKALELDDNLAEAHTVLGWISRNYDWDWPRAEREFQRAIELDPRSAATHHGYAAYFEALGRSEEALNEQKLAQQLDPLSPFYNGQLALGLMNAERYEEAVEQAKKTLELDTTNSRAYYTLGVVHAHQGKYDLAIGELRKSADLSGGRFDVVAKLGETYVRAGRRAEARKILAEWEKQSAHRNVSSLGFATVYASLGEKEKAFAWLGKAYQERSPFLLSIRWNSAFDSLRADPRFAELLRRIGLSP